MEQGLGRLIRTLKDKCPLCNSPIQLRARKISNLLRGIEVESEEEYHQCSKCEYQNEIREHKKRKIVFDKTAFVREEVPEKKGAKKWIYQTRIS